MATASTDKYLAVQGMYQETRSALVQGGKSRNAAKREQEAGPKRAGGRPQKSRRGAIGVVEG